MKVTDINKNIFRAYDIRGKYPSDINEEVAYFIGKGYGTYLQERLGESKCVISHDNRLSSDTLTKSLIEGITESGLDVIYLGLTTTPMHYFGREINDSLGIMVTASHNPKDENGFKFSFDRFANARGEMIEEFYNYLITCNAKFGEGKVINQDIEEEYTNYIINNLKFGKKRLKVVVDPANGTTSKFVEKIFSKLNLDIVMINDTLDGNFPNHHPDPSIEENLQQLKDKVSEVKADLGISFDGDGDRIGIIDEMANKVSIEDYAVIILRNIIDKVESKKFLYDAKCSNVFKDEIERLNGEAIIYRTGSSYTQEKIAKDNIPFGIQAVGHISFNDRMKDVESSIYSSLRLIEILSKTDKTLSELVSTIPKYFTGDEKKFPSTDIKKIEVIDNIKKFCDKQNYKYLEIDGLKVLFEKSWAYVRASNTGPNITLRCEASNKENLDNLEKIFTSLIDLYNN